MNATSAKRRVWRVLLGLLGASALASCADSEGRVEQDSPSPGGEPVAEEAAPLVAQSLVGRDVPSKRIGILYSVWHAPAADALRRVANKGGAQLAVEDLIRTGVPSTDVYARWGIDAASEAMSFFYQARPSLGFYCLYRARPGEAGLIPDCPGISTTAARHAELLVAAGVDHVVVDATNLTGLDGPGQLLQLRPAEVLFEEWAKLRRAGKKTPQIAVWHAVPTGSTQWTGYAKLYQNADYDGLVMRDRVSGKKVFFAVDPPDAARFPDASILQQLASNGGRNDVLVQRMWTIDQTDSNVDRWAFMAPCRSGAASTTSIVGAGACNQPYTPRSALGSAVSVGSSYQTSYASLPFAAAGKLSGLTFARQWQTAFAMRPDYVFISGWNEFTAQPQPNPFPSNPYAASMGLERDAYGRYLFVDVHGMEYGRELEPSTHYGSYYYEMLKSCAKLWKGGATSCSNASEACCRPLTAGDWTHVHVLRNAGAKDTLLTTSAVEKAAVLGSAWREVCARSGTPSVTCVNPNEPASPSGPFLAYAKAAAGRRPLYRCLVGSGHFYSLDSRCEGQRVEGVLAYLADRPTGETPRRATRCYDRMTGEHTVAVGYDCPGGMSQEGVLGWVR